VCVCVCVCSGFGVFIFRRSSRLETCECARPLSFVRSCQRETKKKRGRPSGSSTRLCMNTLSAGEVRDSHTHMSRASTRLGAHASSAARGPTSGRCVRVSALVFASHRRSSWTELRDQTADGVFPPYNWRFLSLIR